MLPWYLSYICIICYILLCHIDLSEIKDMLCYVMLFDSHQDNLMTKWVVIYKWTFVSSAIDNQEVISQEYLDSP